MVCPFSDCHFTGTIFSEQYFTVISRNGPGHKEASLAELLIIECNKHQLCQPRQWFGSVLHVLSKYEFRPVTKYVARLTSGKRMLNIDGQTILANLNAGFYEVLSLKLRDNGQDASPFAICHCFYVRYCVHICRVHWYFRHFRY